MSGTPANASVWADADVLVSLIGSPIPADTSTAFSAAWSLVGLLDGSDGFEESRDEDVKDHFAWGGILVATSRKNFKLTKKFSVLEDNATTRSLIWPGSTASQIIVPRPANLMIAFETRSGGKVRRLISKNYAQITVDGSIKDSEEDLTKAPLAAVIFPDSAGVLFAVQAVPDIVSIAITPLTLALSLAGAITKPLSFEGWGRGGTWAHPEQVRAAMVGRSLTGLDLIVTGIKAGGVMYWPTLAEAAKVAERDNEAEQAAFRSDKALSTFA